MPMKSSPTFKYGRTLAATGQWRVVERACTWGEPYPACGHNYFSVKVDAESSAPDWTTVIYHTHLSEALRRVGLTDWVHPDFRGDQS